MTWQPRGTPTVTHTSAAQRSAHVSRWVSVCHMQPCLKSKESARKWGFCLRPRFPWVARPLSLRGGRHFLQLFFIQDEEHPDMKAIAGCCGTALADVVSVWLREVR